MRAFNVPTLACQRGAAFLWPRVVEILLLYVGPAIGGASLAKVVGGKVWRHNVVVSSFVHELVGVHRITWARVARGKFARLAGCVPFRFAMSQRDFVAGAIRAHGGA